LSKIEKREMSQQSAWSAGKKSVFDYGEAREKDAKQTQKELDEIEAERRRKFDIPRRYLVLFIL